MYYAIISFTLVITLFTVIAIFMGAIGDHIAHKQRMRDRHIARRLNGARHGR
jgi:hypothetical protein